MKKMLMLLLVGMFMISLASAAEFDNVKNTLNTFGDDNYPDVEIKNAFDFPEWLGGKTLFNGTMTDHKEVCEGENCYSIFKVYTSGDSAMIQDVRFKTQLADGSWIDQDVRSFQFYYWTDDEKDLGNNYETQCTDLEEICEWNEENQTNQCYTPQSCSRVQKPTEIAVPEYITECTEETEVCTWIEGDPENHIEGYESCRTPQTCEQVLDGYSNEPNYQWSKYNLGDNPSAGHYWVKLEARKKPTRTVDWQIKTNGKWLTEWAIWGGGNWSKKKNILIEEKDGNNLTNYSILLNITYDADMLANFSDLRFLDESETTELDYWIENKVDSNYADVWVKIPNLNASLNTSIYMYYGNAGVDTTSNRANTFLFVEDWDTYDTSTIWQVDVQDGTMGISGGRWYSSLSAGVTQNSLVSREHFTAPIEVVFEDVQRANDGASGVAAYILQNDTASEYLLGHHAWKDTYSTIDTEGQNEDTGNAITYWGSRTQVLDFHLMTNNTDDFVNATDGTTEKAVFTDKLTTERSNAYEIKLLAQQSQSGAVTEYIGDVTVKRWTPTTPTYTIGAETNAGIVTTLNSPADESISTSPTVTFNATANTGSGGAYITNMSLWTNITGTWALNESITDLGGASPFNFTDGSLVAYYPLNETTGTVRDVSMTGHDGVVNNAFKFDGAKDYFQSPAYNLGTGDYTVSGWYYINEIGTSEEHYLWTFGYNDANSAILFISTTDKYSFLSYKSGSGTSQISTVTPTVGWNYLTLTRSGTSIEFFVNGTSVWNNTYANHDLSLNDPFEVGWATQRASNAYFNGSVDEIGYWSKKLSNAEIQSLYNSGSGKAYSSLTAGEKTNLVSYYSLDEVGSDPLDSHGSNDGTLSGGSLLNSPTRGVNGLIENAFNFSGTNEAIIAGYDLEFSSSPYTMSSWAYFDSLSTNPVLFSTDIDNSNRGIELQVLTDGALQIFDSSGSYKSDTGLISTGQWYHIAWVLDGTNSKIYLNGTNIKNASATYSPTARALTMGIRSTTQQTGDMDGTMDEIGIWDRALTSTEISELYNEGAGLGYSADVQTTSSTQTWTKTISDTTIWNVEACDTDGGCGFATSNYTVYLDATAPQFNLVNVTTPIIYNYGDNVTIDFNVTDNNLDTCWYEYPLSCYQESSVTDNQTGIDGACNLNYSGVEWTKPTGTAFTVSAPSDGSVTDGDWDTLSTDLYEGFIKYPIPNETINNITWKVKDSLGTAELTIPSDCYSGETELFVYVRADKILGGNYQNWWGCYNYTGDSISYLRTGSTAAALRNYEEAISWNGGGTEYFSCTSDVEQELNISSIEDFTNITFYANDSVGNENSTVVSFAFDATTPTFNVESPVSFYDFGYQDEAVDLNVTFTDTNLDSCWYDYNGTNVSIPGCLTGVKNSTNFSLDDHNYNMTIYANDTLGNEGSTFISWDYTLFEHNQTYDDPVVETIQETYEIVLHYESSDWSAVTADLIFPDDGTQTGNVVTAGDEITVTASRYIPELVGDANKSFYWSVSLTNSTSTYSFNSTTQVQNVTPVNFELCNITENPQLYFQTYSASDENTAVNATFESAWTIRNAAGGDVVLSKSFQDLNENVSAWGFCIEPNTSTYTVSVDIVVDAANYTPTTHYIVDTDYNGSTNNVSLYLLDDDLATLTQIKVTDQDNQPVEDVYVTIQRYDLGTDTYYSVGQVKTDSLGVDLAYLNWYDTWYRFIGVLDGEVEFDDGPKKVSATPQAFQIGSIETLHYEKFDDISYSLTYNNVTENFILTYVDSSGLTSSNCLRVIKRNITNDYLVCRTCQASSSATIYCNVADWGNGTFIADYYATGSPEYWIDALVQGINIQATIYDELGNDNGTGLAIIMAGIVLSLFLVSPALAVLGAIAGMFLGSILGFLPMDYATFGGIVVVGGLIMWAVQK